MSLILHIFFHFLISLIAGAIVWKLYGRPILAFLSAIIGGVIVDFDHFIDYFMAFGFNFKLSYFADGFQFLKTDKLYLLFHGWEYVIILLILSQIFTRKARIYPVARYSGAAGAIMAGLALGLFFHLITDVNLNKIPISTYSVIHRTQKNFNLEKLVTIEHWERHQLLKQDFPVFE